MIQAARELDNSETQSQPSRIEGLHFERHPSRLSAMAAVDFENVYFRLKLGLHSTKPINESVHILGRLPEYLHNRFGIDVCLKRAYGDFRRLPPHAMPRLRRLRIHCVAVLASLQKNSTDLALSLDVCQSLYKQRHIDSFVIVGGDCDYLPVAKVIRTFGKRLVIVGFEAYTSRLLRRFVGEENFVSADALRPSSAVPNQV